MAFIKKSVGRDGVNDKADVDTIVELIPQAQTNFPFLLQPTVNNLNQTGNLFSIGVNQAIEEFIRYAERLYSILKIPDSQRKGLNQTTIYPSGLNYQILPACAVCGNRPPNFTDFNQNPLLKKALGNTVSYSEFKQAIAFGSSCNDAVNIQSTAEKLDESTVDLLRRNLVKLYANQTFKTFIEAVIDALPNEPQQSLRHLNAKKYTGTILENFDRVRNAKGYWIDFVKGADAFYQPGKITFNRAEFKPASTVPLAFIVDSNGKPSTSMFSGHTKNSQGTEALKTTFTLAHELIHGYWTPIDVGTIMDHDYMDDATQAALAKLEIKSAIPFYRDHWAHYFTAVLYQVCGNIKL